MLVLLHAAYVQLGDLKCIFYYGFQSDKLERSCCGDWMLSLPLEGLAWGFWTDFTAHVPRNGGWRGRGYRTVSSTRHFPKEMTLIYSTLNFPGCWVPTSKYQLRIPVWGSVTSGCPTVYFLVEMKILIKQLLFLLIRRAQVVEWLHTHLFFSIILRTPPTIVSAPPTILLGGPWKAECKAEEGLHQQGTTIQHRELYSLFCSNLQGKRIRKWHIYRHIHTYMKLNHLAVHLKLTQHCKSTLLQ